jgi:hypothetical protein
MPSKYKEIILEMHLTYNELFIKQQIATGNQQESNKK